MLNYILVICQFIAIISFLILLISIVLSFKSNKLSVKAEKAMIIFAVIYLLFYGISTFLDNYLQPPKPDISTRIENVSANLTDISTEIEEIQSELEQRIELVADLKKEAEIAENFISLSDDQVSAIQDKLKQEFESNSGKSLLQSVLINTFFFALGIIFPKIINLRKKNPTKIDNSDSDSSLNSYSEDEIAQAARLLDTIKRGKK